MATDEDTTVVPSPGFEPEPIPDTIADTELNGLEPAAPSTDEQPVEPEQEETSDDQPEADPPADESPEDAAEELGTPEEEAGEQPKAEDAKSTEETPTDPKELARQRYEERKAAKAERDYIDTERKRIREYEQTQDMTDPENKQAVTDAKLFLYEVQQNRTALVNEAQQAAQTIPLFNPQSPEFNQVLYEKALRDFNDNYVVTDPDSGEVLGAEDRQGNRVSLYQYLQQEAQDMSAILGTTRQQSQRTAQQAEAKMRAKAVTPANTGKQTSSGDELQDLLDKVGDTPLF